MEQVAFIVWRESVEALLAPWLRQSPQGRGGLAYLWGGVVAGLALAVALALVLLGVSSWLSDQGQEWFLGGMALVASALVLQMVVWMRRHGRALKSELQAGASASMQRANWWGLFVLSMIAVAREGSETVVFLYGTISAGAAQSGAISLALAGAGGFAAALVTFWLLQLGGRLITWRRFFILTEILLLLLAGSLLVGGLDHFISLGVLPTLMDPVWDSSWLLDDSSGVGKILAQFAGYRAYPALSTLLIFLLYWILAWTLLRGTRKRPNLAVSGAR
jgi:high-affinity iron transporter